MNFKECSEESNNKKISIEENRIKFTLLNKSKRQISKVLVDGCLVNDNRMLGRFYLLILLNSISYNQKSETNMLTMQQMERDLYRLLTHSTSY